MPTPKLVALSTTPVLLSGKGLRNFLILFNNSQEQLLLGPSATITASLYSYPVGAGQVHVMTESVLNAFGEVWGMLASGAGTAHVTEG